LYVLFGLIHIGLVRPQVLHAHGLFSTTATAVLARRLYHLPVAAKVLRGGVLGDVLRLKEKVMGAIRIANLRRNVNTFIAISEEIRRELLAEGVPPDRIAYIPNGVDIERFKPLLPEEKRQRRASMNLADVPTVIYVGRLAPEKRVNHLLKSWEVVNQSCRDAQLLILGKGQERKALEALAGDTVHFVGYVENVPEWLQLADIFVLPSISEGLSNSLLEAMSCGLAIIATAVGDAPNLVRSQENGWLIPADDVTALTDSLLAALGNFQRSQDTGKRGRERILQHFQLAATADKLQQLYQNMLQKEARDPGFALPKKDSP
jgi:glycosyltransferase involved in cell wall biosynthesis